MLAFRIVPPSVPNATAKRLISCATAKRSTRQAAGPLTRYLPNVFKGNRIAVALWFAAPSSRRRKKSTSLVAWDDVCRSDGIREKQREPCLS